MFVFKKVLIFIIAAPVFIWLLKNPSELFSEWIKIPDYFRENVSNLISPDKLTKVYAERWNAFGPEKEDFLSKAFYGKPLVLVDDFFSLLTYLSPRLYFQSGDGTDFSPPRVEPIAAPLFFFWILGIISLIKRKKFMPVILVLVFDIFAYIFGHRNFAFLFPIAIIYTGISISGIDSLGSKLTKKIIYSFLLMYGLYLFGRIFLLK